eukprot:4915419-Prymnesium_polylepis.2
MKWLEHAWGTHYLALIALSKCQQQTCQFHPPPLLVFDGLSKVDQPDLAMWSHDEVALHAQGALTACGGALRLLLRRFVVLGVWFCAQCVWRRLAAHRVRVAVEEAFHQNQMAVRRAQVVHKPLRIERALAHHLTEPALDDRPNESPPDRLVRLHLRKARLGAHFQRMLALLLELLDQHSLRNHLFPHVLGEFGGRHTVPLGRLLPKAVEHRRDRHPRDTRHDENRLCHEALDRLRDQHLRHGSGQSRVHARQARRLLEQVELPEHRLVVDLYCLPLFDGRADTSEE